MGCAQVISCRTRWVAAALAIFSLTLTSCSGSDGLTGKSEESVRSDSGRASATDRTGERLKDLAPPSFAVGSVLHGYSPSWRFDAYRQLIRDESNAITVTAYMPWGGWPNNGDGEPDTSGLNQVSTWAQANGKRLHGHTLVYPAANLQSDWFQNLPNEQVGGRLDRYISAMAGKTRGRMWVWDVVNEAMGDIVELDNRISVDADGVRKGVWIDGVFNPFKEYSALGQDYIARSFRQAKIADPSALLIINDYGTDTVNPKSTKLFELVQKLRSDNVPVDGIGVQLHWENMNDEPDYQSISTNFKRFVDAGFKVFITEVDVAAIKTDNALRDSPSAEQLARQQRIYEGYLRVALNEPGVESFLLWDAADDQSWWHPTRQVIGDVPIGTYMYPTPFWGGDTAGQYPISAKPAYYGLQSVLASFTGTYQLRSAWSPENGYLTRRGDDNGQGGYRSSASLNLYALDDRSKDWSSMKWSVQRVALNQYKLISQWDSGSGYLTRRGEQIALEPLAENPAGQIWHLEPIDGTNYRLRNGNADLARYLTRVGEKDGADNYQPTDRIELNRFNSDWSSQIWTLRRSAGDN